MLQTVCQVFQQGIPLLWVNIDCVWCTHSAPPFVILQSLSCVLRRCRVVEARVLQFFIVHTCLAFCSSSALSNVIHVSRLRVYTSLYMYFLYLSSCSGRSLGIICISWSNMSFNVLCGCHCWQTPLLAGTIMLYGVL